MELKRISRWIVIAGALIIWLIKFGIRPYYDFGQPANFFLGIAPNLLGSFLIPFGACWFFVGREFLVAKIFRIHSLVDLRNVCVLGFAMLVVNEYLQLIPLFGRTFDYFDIASSAIGLLTSYFVFGRLYSRIMFRIYPDWSTAVIRYDNPFAIYFSKDKCKMTTGITNRSCQMIFPGYMKVFWWKLFNMKKSKS